MEICHFLSQIQKNALLFTGLRSWQSVSLESNLWLSLPWNANLIFLNQKFILDDGK